LGSDINNKLVRLISKHIVIKRIDAAVFVSKALYIKAGQPSKSEVIPFGVNFKKFYPLDKAQCRKQLGMSDDVKYILFSARFDRAVKNAPLAFKAIKKVQKYKLELVELKNIPDDKMNMLFNACDICLMTSINEGSPQFIKEAMACNKPIVSTNVGDVEWIFGETPGHFLTTDDPDAVAGSIINAFDFLAHKAETMGRRRLEKLNIDIDSATKRNIDIYHKIISRYKD
jgi:glycosyltransferase involved in cell wall biosynthesis